MKLLIDTSLEHLFINLMDESFNKIDTVLKIEKKKADILSNEISLLLVKNKISIIDITAIYITLGPGSFMGARTALVYARTIAQVSDIKLYTASTLCLFKDEAFIDAKGGFAYTSGDKIVKYNGTFTTPDYDDILENPKSYLNQFKLESNLTSVKPNYLKEPQVGGK